MLFQYNKEICYYFLDFDIWQYDVKKLSSYRFMFRYMLYYITIDLGYKYYNIIL